MAESSKRSLLTWPEIRKQVLLTLICFPLAAALSFVGQGVLKRTHVLDPTTEYLSARAMSIDRDLAAWIVALIVSLALYGFVLWKVWRPRNIHHQHGEKRAETKPVASLGIEVTRSAPVEPSAVIGSKARRPPPRTWVDAAAELAPPRKTLIDEMIEGKHRKAVEEGMKPKRDVPLGHAIAYACLGTWDQSGELPRLIKEDGILVEKLKAFEQKARDGDLTVWGTTYPDDGGQWYSPLEPIPAEHWKSHWVQPATLVDRANSFSRPMFDNDGERYFDLMVNKAQIEKAFPKAVAPNETAPQPPLEAWVPLDQAIRYLAKGSQWGLEQNQEDPHFSVNLGIQLRDA